MAPRDAGSQQQTEPLLDTLPPLAALGSHLYPLSDCYEGRGCIGEVKTDIQLPQSRANQQGIGISWSYRRGSERYVANEDASARGLPKAGCARTATVPSGCKYARCQSLLVVTLMGHPSRIATSAEAQAPGLLQPQQDLRNWLQSDLSAQQIAKRIGGYTEVHHKCFHVPQAHRTSWRQSDMRLARSR